MENRERDEQYMLRMPNGMRGLLKDMAKENMRTLNSEIVLALKNWISLKNEKSGTPA